MVHPVLKPYLERLSRRSLERGGFVNQHRGGYRPDATAWAILIIQNCDPDSPLLERARTRLTQDQLEDGRVSISPDHPDVFWPTSLAILAWNDAPSFREHQARALHFLLNKSGKDGWPWTANTHTWVQPTALGMMAMKATDVIGHKRIELAKEMLMDRQLPHGGWNYGNTTVFGQELHPFPETTGAALNALENEVPHQEIEKSLDYLAREISKLRTPIALGWGLLGLGAWHRRPTSWPRLVKSCLEREERYGEYDTASLCLLLSTYLTPNGLDTLSTHTTHNATTTG